MPPAMLTCFSLKGRGTLKGEKRRREEGKVNDPSKNVYRADVVHSHHYSNIRP